MIPNADQLQAISKMREGDLGEIPFAVVLHALAAHGRSAVLEIERKPMKKEIFLEDGTPVDCRSNLLHETLSRFMVARGILDDEESQKYLNKAAQKGLKFGEALILDDKISASELYKVLQQNLARKLLDGFAWRSGSFRIRHELPEVDSPLQVKAPQLVVTGIAKFSNDDEVNSAIGPLVGKKVILHPDPPFPVDEIRLSPGQEEIVDLLVEGKRIDELAAESKIPFDQIMRLLYSLAVIGVVVPEDWLPADAPKPKKPRRARKKAAPAAEEASAEVRAAEELLPAEIEKRSNRVMEAFLKHRSQDAFELLGLEETAQPLDIQDAYLEFSRAYAPWEFDVPGLKSLVEKAEDLFLAGGRAFGELCDVDRRNELIQRRRTLRESNAEKKDTASRFAIQSELLDSELQYKKGKAMMKKGRWKEAIKLLEFAYDCDPQNATYRAELAFSRFMDSPMTRAEEAKEELEESLRLDPKSGLAHYYLGLVQTDVEEYDEAKEHLETALRLMKGDRRPIEALKELQQVRKQKKKRLSFLGG